MVVVLPYWFDELRRDEVTNRLRNDPRTTGDNLLGLRRDQAFFEAVGGGQADFDAPWGNYSAEDRTLLYAYHNQKGHVEELVQAFTLLFGRGAMQNPVVIDLGCGPFTGGLALTSVLGNRAQFTYIGLDRSSAMMRLGERLALKAEELGALTAGERIWISDLDTLKWPHPLGWRPLLIIVSYLLASPTLDATGVVAQLETVVAQISRGPVTVLYTNSPRPDANRSFPVFRHALESAGFVAIIDDTGSIHLDRWGGPRERHVRYALFQRQPQTTLNLGRAP